MTAMLTREEVAGLLKVSLRTVDRLRTRGELKAVKVMGTIRFKAEAVQAFIEAAPNGSRIPSAPCPA